MVTNLPHPKVIEKQDRSGQPKGERVNIMFEATVSINKLRDLWHKNHLLAANQWNFLTQCHDKKCNKIGMVVAGFILAKYDESG